MDEELDDTKLTESEDLLKMALMGGIPTEHLSGQIGNSQLQVELIERNQEWRKKLIERLKKLESDTD